MTIQLEWLIECEAPCFGERLVAVSCPNVYVMYRVMNFYFNFQRSRDDFVIISSQWCLILAASSSTGPISSVRITRCKNRFVWKEVCTQQKSNIFQYSLSSFSIQKWLTWGLVTNFQGHPNDISPIISSHYFLQSCYFSANHIPIPAGQLADLAHRGLILAFTPCAVEREPDPGLEPPWESAILREVSWVHNVYWGFSNWGSPKMAGL